MYEFLQSSNFSIKKVKQFSFYTPKLEVMCANPLIEQCWAVEINNELSAFQVFEQRRPVGDGLGAAGVRRLDPAGVVLKYRVGFRPT
jgi:hypothetical protein